jgi:hypothetical protein
MKRWLTIISVLLAVKTYAGIMIVGNMTHEKICQSGEVYKGEIIIRNTGDKEEEVRIYQTDYRFFCDGSSEYGEPNSLERSNASWIEFSPQRFRLPAHEQRIIQYRVEVPRRQLKEGTYWSILMVESVPELNPDVIEEGVGITTVMRYGIQMISHLGESGLRQVKFVNTRLLSEDNTRILEVDIENTGERMLRPSVWVEFFHESGKSAGTYEGFAYRVYPGTSVRHRIELAGIEEGDYKALVVADCGDDDIFGINYSIQVGR